MKRLSLKKLAEAVTSYRRAGGITQAEFAKKAADISIGIMIDFEKYLWGFHIYPLWMKIQENFYLFRYKNYLMYSFL